MEWGFEEDWDDAVRVWYDFAKETRVCKRGPKDLILEFLLKVRRLAPDIQKCQANRSMWRHRRKLTRQNQKAFLVEAAKAGSLPKGSQGHV